MLLLDLAFGVVVVDVAAVADVAIVDDIVDVVDTPVLRIALRRWLLTDVEQ